MGLGDEIMASGDARRAWEAQPARAAGAGRRRVAILDRRGLPRWHELWEGIEHIWRAPFPGAVLPPGHPFIRHGGSCRPYIADKLRDQGGERWIYNAAYRATPGALHLPEQAQRTARSLRERLGPFVVVEPTVKAKASPNKRWPWHAWQELAESLRGSTALVQMGPPGTPALSGVRQVETFDPRTAFAILARAEAVVTHEGALHHAAAALGIPAVVLRGAFIAPQVTGYPGQADLWRPHLPATAAWPEGESCGRRFHCPDCAAAMTTITAGDVVSAFKQVTHGKSTAAA